MIQLIQAATTSKSNQERKQAQKTILQARQQNKDVFFQQAIEIFASSETPLNIRQATGTLIAVSVVAKNAQNEYYWDALNGNTKNIVKNTNLGVLIDPQRAVRRAAANIVSAICFIELPRKQWDGIVQKICANVGYESQIVKQASILTLGFICSRMKQKIDFTFTPQLQQNILSGIILGLQQTQPHLIETTLKALRDSIGSFGDILQNQQYRTFTLKKLVQIINSEKYTLDGLQILGQFVKSAYQHLGPYIQSLIQILQPLVANSKNEDNCIATIEVYENIAAQYKDLSDLNKVPNHISGNNGIRIVTSLLQKLSDMQDEDQSDENPISDSASKALQTIFENGSMQYKQLVLQFVKHSISQNNWKHRQASIKAFSLLLYGLPDKQNQILITSSINQLMGLLSDNSKQVQSATLDSLTIITQVCGKIILKSPNFIEYLKVILSKLSISQKFLKTVCRIIDNLCQAEKQQKLGKFSPISDDLLNLLLKYALANQSTLSIINVATTSILNIFEVAHNEIVYRKYISFVLQNFDNISQISQVERRQQISSAFFCIIQFCLHGLKNVQLDETTAANIYTKVVNSFKAKNDVNADGLYAIEALVPFFNGNPALVNDFWAYIIHALQKWQDSYLFRASMSCIASFINCYGDSLGQKLGTFVPQFIELLQNPSFPKQLKLECLIIIGQVFLICGKAGIQYLQRFLDVILLCCSAALQIADIDFSYSQQLKDHILQTLMCIVHGLSSEPTANQIIPPYIPKILQFIMLSSNKKWRPTVTYMKKCVLLMTDFSKIYPQVVKPYKKQAFITDCINALKNFNKNRQHDKTIKYAEQHLK